MISNAPVLHSRADTTGAGFARNDAANAALAAELRQSWPRSAGAARARRGSGTSSAASCCRATGWTRCSTRLAVPRAVAAGRDGLYDGDAPAAGIITGVGRVCGRECVIVANDATVKGGTYYPVTVKKHLRAQEVALHNHLPCIYLVDSGGAFLPRQDEVFPDREHFGRIFYNQATMSARGIPQIAAVLGSCTAGGAYVPAMSDENVIVRNQGTIFLGGPPLVKAATGEVVTAEDLGGGELHSRVSGVTDHLAEDDADALRIVRGIVATLARARPAPGTRRRRGARLPGGAVRRRAADLRTPYDVHEVIARVVDGSRFAEFKAEYGATLVTGFARIYGHPVGHHRQQRDLVQRVRSQGRALHRAVRPAQDPAGVPAEHHRLHGRQAVRGGRHRQARGQDGHRGLLRPGAEAHRDHRRLVRRGELRDVRPGLLPPLPVDVAERPDLRDGRRPGRQRARHRPARPARGPRRGLAAGGGGGVQAAVRDQYEHQGNPYYSTARLWDDGIIDPADTRRVLGLALSAAANAPLEAAGYGVFRM